MLSADLLILRYSTSRIRLAQHLGARENYLVFQADALVYFYKNIGTGSPKNSIISRQKRLKNLVFRPADASDLVLIDQLSRVIFENYPNHYRANSRLPSEAIRDGYIEWAQVGLRDAAKLTVIVENETEKPIGLALVAFDGDLAEIELNGIHPDAQGQGAYSALLEWLSNHLVERGVKKLCISTQIQNERVIRAWIRSGFNLEFSLNTIHLMPRN